MTTYSKEYYQKNKDRIRAVQNRYRAKNRAIINVLQQMKIQSLPEPEKERRRSLTRKWSLKNYAKKYRQYYRARRKVVTHIRELLQQQEPRTPLATLRLLPVPKKPAPYVSRVEKYGQRLHRLAREARARVVTDNPLNSSN